MVNNRCHDKCLTCCLTKKEDNFVKFLDTMFLKGCILNVYCTKYLEKAPHTQDLLPRGMDIGSNKNASLLGPEGLPHFFEPASTPHGKRSHSCAVFSKYVKISPKDVHIGSKHAQPPNIGQIVMLYKGYFQGQIKLIA